MDGFRRCIASTGESEVYGISGIEQKNLIILILDEIVTNIIKYGSETPGTVAIDIEITRDEDALTMRIEDDGIPFNPLEAPQPDLDSSLEDRKIGGLGLYMIREMSDSFEYAFIGERNSVSITKRNR